MSGLYNFASNCATSSYNYANSCEESILNRRDTGEWTLGRHATIVAGDIGGAALGIITIGSLGASLPIFAIARLPGCKQKCWYDFSDM